MNLLWEKFREKIILTNYTSTRAFNLDTLNNIFMGWLQEIISIISIYSSSGGFISLIRWLKCNEPWNKSMARKDLWRANSILIKSWLLCNNTLKYRLDDMRRCRKIYIIRTCLSFLTQLNRYYSILFQIRIFLFV